ncbi:hypothetical protein N7470_006698 [Penicillium chermesinum]|nr:hypothetical protein N7470_006698 [Penicillium chermesinum]
MQFTKSLLLLAAFTGGALARAEGHARRQATTPASTPSSASGSSSGGAWTATPSGPGSTAGFGGSTSGGGSGATYQGNIGNPYGSNIIEVSESDASSYEYVIQFKGQNTEDWTVVVWNKYSSDGTMDGFFGKATTTFTLLPAPPSTSPSTATPRVVGLLLLVLPFPLAALESTPPPGESSTLARPPTTAGLVSTSPPSRPRTMASRFRVCRSVMPLAPPALPSPPNAGTVNNAYTSAQTDVGGIGGNLASGPVRLVVTIAYSG